MDSQEVALALGETTQEELNVIRIREQEAELAAKDLKILKLQEKLDQVEPLLNLFKRVPKRTRSG